LLGIVIGEISGLVVSSILVVSYFLLKKPSTKSIKVGRKEKTHKGKKEYVLKFIGISLLCIFILIILLGMNLFTSVVFGVLVGGGITQVLENDKKKE